MVTPSTPHSASSWSIYNPLSRDSETASCASAQGGVTTGLTYMRTGKYYLNRGGPYAEFFPHVVAGSEGRSYIDYAGQGRSAHGGHHVPAGLLTRPAGLGADPAVFVRVGVRAHSSPDDLHAIAHASSRARLMFAS